MVKRLSQPHGMRIERCPPDTTACLLTFVVGSVRISIPYQDAGSHSEEFIGETGLTRRLIVPSIQQLLVKEELVHPPRFPV